MRKRFEKVLIWVVTAVTLGSGIINIQSVIGPGLHAREVLLRRIFPLEFLHLSRSLTLFAGFALVILSLNVYRRKKRAFRLSVLLAGCSILFHLTKGLDYEEAAFALALMVLLLLMRHSFTVESNVPHWRDTLPRVGLAAAVALVYGVAGFWVLEPKEFGVNLTLIDSIRSTLLFLSLAADPQIAPHTAYARWFVNSLYLVTIIGVVYVGFALFRPVVYRYATHARGLAQAQATVQKYGRSAQDFFKTRPDKSLFFSLSHRSFLSYSVGANFALVLADPVGPADDIEACIREFAAYCRNNDWGLAFYQALPDFLPVYARLGFKRLKIGDEAIVDLTAFCRAGKGAKDFRRKRKLEQDGVHAQLQQPPIPDEILEQMRHVSDEWLGIPGRRERQFTLGWFDRDYLRQTPIFTVFDAENKMLAFANLVPSYCKGEATIDLMRRRTSAPNGVMDYLFVKLFEFTKDQGFERFNLGLAPMAGFREKEEARPEERAVHAFFQHLNFLFSYKGLRDYKAKFASSWEPRYAVYRHVLDLPRLAIALGKVSEIRD
jgi:phosphatidylglycerol lysyltransferase